MTLIDTELLPITWTQANLLEIAELIRGVTYSKGDATDSPIHDHMGVLRANNITKRGLSLSDLVYVPSKLISKSQYVRRNDILIATSSGSINAVGKAARAVNDLNVGFGAFCGLIRPATAVEARFIGHFFGSYEYRSYVSSVARGVNINNLKREHFGNIEIPFPPLPEQIRIADKLDTLLARVEAGRERLERVPKLVKAFRQAVLSAAVSGELTREWRGGRDADWAETTVGECIESLRNGVAAKPNELSSGTPILKISSVRPFSVKTEENRFVTLSQGEEKTFNLSINDILVTRYNGSLDLVGVAGMVRSPEVENFTYPDKLIRIRANTSTISDFLEISINSPASRSVIKEAAKTTSGQTGISGKDLKELKIFLPPLPEQAEIVRRVEALFTLVNRLEARYQSALASFDRLTPALLAKAFRGELVPQDPNDEPVSVLLERIRAQRATEGSKPKRGRGAAPSSAEEPKRRGRPPKAQAEVGEQVPSAEAAAQTPDLQPPRRRGRPPKVRPEAQAQAPAAIPKASSYEDAVRKLEALKLERAGGTRQVSLFDEEPQPG